jgi:hypothetical protein
MLRSLVKSSAMMPELPSCLGSFLLLWIVTALSTTALCQAEDSRRAWRFETESGKRTIVDQGGGRWVTYYPNGTMAQCVELDRVPEYVEIRNLSNQAVQRLYASYGMVQKKPGGSVLAICNGEVARRWLYAGEGEQVRSDGL